MRRVVPVMVVLVPPDALRDGRTQSGSIDPAIRGTMIPAAYFDEVLRLRDEYRSAAGLPPQASQ